MKPSSQRGVAALLVVLVLLGATLLGLLASQRHLLLELRLSANQVRSGEAFEAAEAGLDWATAQLNTPQPVDATCRPAAVGTPDFRARHLTIDATGRITPAAVATRCEHDGSVWACRCAQAALPAASASAPSFTVRLADGGRPGIVRLVAEGAGPPDGQTHHEALLALLPALALAPATAMTLRDPALPAEAFAARHLGQARAAWAARPDVRRVACSGDCGAALLAAASQQPLLAVDGDVLLRGPLTLGSAAQPVLLSVSGRLRVEGAVALSGLVHAGALEWVGPTGPWRGAVLSDTTAAGSGPFDLVHDAAALAPLRFRHGALLRVPGSWRDF